MCVHFHRRPALFLSLCVGFFFPHESEVRESTPYVALIYRPGALAVRALYIDFKNIFRPCFFVIILTRNSEIS